ncbi:hypothetical protein J2S01_001689 [Pectinatus haikarae]|uniref:Uncharacterized protein n=1 Tax=Pectinatus haikarae TaxID=349096 RepID=A0ABT9YA38_9FIRM|nr:hypothetical protein [Pectinatus haikarae]
MKENAALLAKAAAPAYLAYKIHLWARYAGKY